MRAGSRQLEEICGTAFPVGGDAFLTAGHVARAAGSTETCELGVLGEGGRKIEGERVQGVEIFTEVDIALLRLEIPTAQPVPWRSDNLAMLQSVQTAGYPHAVNSGDGSIVTRAFRGEIVSDPARWTRLPALPSIYELSFQCPRGLSGAPLWPYDESALSGSRHAVAGVILGNEIVDMTVYSERETIKEAGVERELIKTESLHLGIAIKAKAVLALRSDSLGCTIEEWLRRRSLLV